MQLEVENIMLHEHLRKNGIGVEEIVGSGGGDTCKSKRQKKAKCEWQP